jgi:hypothetical protein
MDLRPQALPSILIKDSEICFGELKREYSTAKTRYLSRTMGR